MQIHNPSTAATRWLTVMILAIIAAGLLVELGRSLGQAQAQQLEPIRQDSPAPVPAAAGQVVAVTGEIASNQFGVYLIDTRTRTVALYQWSARKRLEWLASRYYGFDMQVEDWNTEIKPKEVKELIDKASRLEESR
ncbi:MAG: hypothetical protein ACLFUJ_16900 [Phycisphaerae bacterium]